MDHYLPRSRVSAVRQGGFWETEPREGSQM